MLLLMNFKMVLANEKRFTSLPSQSRRIIKVNIPQTCGGACGVVVIAVGNEHGDTSSNPGRD